MSKASREGLNLPMKTQAEPVNQLDGQHFSMIERALKRHRYREDALIEVLHVTQEAFGYTPEMRSST